MKIDWTLPGSLPDQIERINIGYRVYASSIINNIHAITITVLYDISYCHQTSYACFLFFFGCRLIITGAPSTFNKNAPLWDTGCYSFPRITFIFKLHYIRVAIFTGLGTCIPLTSCINPIPFEWRLYLTRAPISNEGSNIGYRVFASLLNDISIVTFTVLLT